MRVLVELTCVDLPCQAFRARKRLGQDVRTPALGRSTYCTVDYAQVPVPASQGRSAPVSDSLPARYPRYRDVIGVIRVTEL